MESNMKNYAVVEFNEKKNNKKVVELVPLCWLSERETMCSWPPKEDVPKLARWIEMAIGPFESWLKYPIKIICKASKYSKLYLTT